MVSHCFDIFYQSPRVACCVLSSAEFPPSAPRPHSLSVHRQSNGPFLPPQGRGGHGLRYSTPWSRLFFAYSLRVQRSSSAPSVCAGPPQRFDGLPQPRLSGPGVRMDPFRGRLPGVVPALAGHGGPICYLSQPTPPGRLLSDGGSLGCGHRCSASVLGSSPSLRLPAVRVDPAFPHQGSPLPQPGGDSGGSVLAVPSVVPGSLGAPGGSAGPSTSEQGPPAPTPLSPLLPEPPSARSDWVSHCQ